MAPELDAICLLVTLTELPFWFIFGVSASKKHQEIMCGEQMNVSKTLS
jgi:hypothetical protein